MKRRSQTLVFPERATTTQMAVVLPAFAPMPLAHQGGWDEILLVVAPLALIGVLLWVANRRVTAQIAAGAADPAANTGDEDQDSSQSTGGDGNR